MRDLLGYHGLMVHSTYQFILATAGGTPFYRGAWANLRHGNANMDVLVALGTSAAYLLSVYNTFVVPGRLYYEAAAVIITLVLLDKTLELVARGRTSEAIRKLMGLQERGPCDSGRP